MQISLESKLPDVGFRRHAVTDVSGLRVGPGLPTQGCRMCPLDTRRQLPGREEELRATVRVVPSGRPWGPSGNARAGFCPWGRAISNVGAQTQSKSPRRGAIKGEGVMGAGQSWCRAARQRGQLRGAKGTGCVQWEEAVGLGRGVEGEEGK